MVTVDFLDPKSKNILVGVRQRVAMWGNIGRAITRATEAVQTASRLIGSGPGAMGAEFRPNGRRVLRLNEIATEEPLWIIGDVCGDVLALEIILGFIDEATRKGQSPQIVFLGDLTAGTLGDAACLAIALERFAAAPTKTILIAGDRELALRSSISRAGEDNNPRCLANMPVDTSHQDALNLLIRSFSQLVANLPLAAVCPGGILLAHGGPPLPFVLSTIESADALESLPDVLRAFALNNLYVRDRQTAPISNSAGAPSDIEDFSNSIRDLSRIVGMPIERMVIGHKEIADGNRWFQNYGEGVLFTLATMCDLLPKEFGGGRRKPCVARLKLGRMRMVRFAIPEELAITTEQIFPRNIATPPIEINAPLSESETDLYEMSSLRMDSIKTPKPFTKNSAHAVDMHVDQAHFENGVRLLAARAWPGARQAFQEAGAATANMNFCLMNEAVACLSMGLPGHQDALGLCRALIRDDSKNAYAYFNMGISYLTSERNPIEAGRAFRTVTQMLPQFGDGWWALGLAFSLRSDRRNAANAFTKAAEYGCQLSTPSSLEGIIPARELSSIFEALRGRAQYHPSLTAQSAPLAGA